MSEKEGICPFCGELLKECENCKDAKCPEHGHFSEAGLKRVYEELDKPDTINANFTLKFRHMNNIGRVSMDKNFAALWAKDPDKFAIVPDFFYSVDSEGKVASITIRSVSLILRENMSLKGIKLE